MPNPPPSEIQKLRMILAGTSRQPITREQYNIQLLKKASQEASAVASPANRPMEYLSALYVALLRPHMGQAA